MKKFIEVTGIGDEKIILATNAIVYFTNRKDGNLVIFCNGINALNTGNVLIVKETYDELKQLIEL